MASNWFFGRRAKVEQTQAEMTQAEPVLPDTGEAGASNLGGTDVGEVRQEMPPLKASWMEFPSAHDMPAREFWLRVAEAKAWCDSAYHPRDLWAHDFQLPLLGYGDSGLVWAAGQARGADLARFHCGRTWAEGITPAEEAEQVRAESVHRAALMRRALMALPAMNGGRLLCYFPEEQLSDGAAQNESHGFFDVHNCPPPATWCGYFSEGPNALRSFSRNYVLSYVPPRMLALADAGVIINPESCIEWLSESDIELRMAWPRLLGELPTVLAELG